MVAPLLLAATNASSALQAAKTANARDASKEIAKLWHALLPLLDGVSEPLRINQRLHKIVVATQHAVNILLKDDEKATVFRQSGEELLAARDRVVASFRERLEGYFRGLPAGPQDLELYVPPEGLPREECATCLIQDFVAEAHEMAKLVLKLHILTARHVQDMGY
ncbi:unnamed protein product [Symbiodinium microadriaticum]|nr:unnamed protein product [Symbiodinium microadriaticum]